MTGPDIHNNRRRFLSSFLMFLKNKQGCTVSLRVHFLVFGVNQESEKVRLVQNSLV